MSDISTYEFVSTTHYRGMSSTDPAGKIEGIQEEAVCKAIELVKRFSFNHPVEIAILLNDKVLGVVDKDLTFKPSAGTQKQESKNLEITASIRHAVDVLYWKKKAAQKALDDVLQSEAQVATQLECDENNNHHFEFTESKIVRGYSPDSSHKVKCQNCEFTTYVKPDFDLNSLNDKNKKSK